MTVADEILGLITEQEPQAWKGEKHPRAPKGKKKKDQYKGGEFVPKDSGGVTKPAAPEGPHPIYTLVTKVRKNAGRMERHHAGDIVTYQGQEHKIVARDGDFVFLKPRIHNPQVNRTYETLTIRAHASDISGPKQIKGQDTLGLKGTIGKPVEPEVPSKGVIVPPEDTSLPPEQSYTPEVPNEPLATKKFATGTVSEKGDGVEYLGGGINSSYKVAIEGDGNGLWKPFYNVYDTEDDCFWYEEHLDKCPMGHREIMVSQIADVLGPEFSGLVPKTVEKELPNKQIDAIENAGNSKGSCQLWLNDYKEIGSLDDEERNQALASLPKGEVEHASGFDDLIAGNDRHSANWGFSGNHIVFIDNGLSLGVSKSVYKTMRSFLNEDHRRRGYFKPAQIRKSKDYRLAFQRADQHKDEIKKIFKTWGLPKDEQDAFWLRLKQGLTKGVPAVVEPDEAPPDTVGQTTKDFNAEMADIAVKEPGSPVGAPPPHEVAKPIADWIMANKPAIDKILAKNYGSGFLAGIESDPIKNRLMMVKQDAELIALARKAGIDADKLTKFGHEQQTPIAAKAPVRTKFGHQADFKRRRVDRKDVEPFIAQNKAVIDAVIDNGPRAIAGVPIDDKERLKWVLNHEKLNNLFWSWMRDKGANAPKLADQVKAVVPKKAPNKALWNNLKNPVRTKFGHLADHMGRRVDLKKDLYPFITQNQDAIDAQIKGAEINHPPVVTDNERQEWILNNTPINKMFWDWKNARDMKGKK